MLVCFLGFWVFRLVVAAGFVWVRMIQFLCGLCAVDFRHWCTWECCG